MAAHKTGEVPASMELPLSLPNKQLFTCVTMSEGSSTTKKT